MLRTSGRGVTGPDGRMTGLPLVPIATGFALCLALAACAAALLTARRLRTELRALRQRALALADVLDVWQWRSDADHRLRELRPPADAGDAAWTLAATAARPPIWMQFRPIEDADGDAVRKLLQACAPITDLAVRMAATDGPATGSPITGRLRAVALTDADGRFAGYVGTLRLAPPQAKTSRPDASPTDERESFAYTVSHDLRAPIRVVEGFTRILKEDYGRLLDRIGNDHLDRVLGAAARMHSMIDALLALSQLSIQPLARLPVDLTQLAHHVADDLRRQWPGRNVTLTIEPDLHAQGDPTLLRVMLENLLGNAWKYTARRAEAQIWFGHDPATPPGTYTVRDNGAGFDMRFNDRLFGAFQRLHSASDFQGTGVGLASVRRIVRRHGGEVWAEAEVERGARFNFSLGDA